MTPSDEFVRMLNKKIDAGEITVLQKDEVLIERSHYDAHRTELNRNYPHEVVAFSKGQMFVGATVV